MGAFRETFFLLVTLVSRNTLLIHYYPKILQTGHFVSQNSPQDKHLQKKESIPQCSQWKLLQDGNKNNIWRRILRGVNSRTKWAFLGYFEKIPKTPILGLSKNQKSFFLILSRVNPGCIFYVDFRNIRFFIIGCHLPCPLFSLNWLLTPL